ncbi:hypothetical protein CHUAL_005003 [Chamberlinius hualienensis]
MENPSNLIRKGKFVNKVPTVIGTVSDEFYIFFDEFFKFCKGQGREWLEKRFPKCFKHLFEGVSSEMSEVFSAIRKNYYENIHVDDHEELEKVVVQMLSDVMFHGPASKTAEFLSSAGVPTYVYKYSHMGQHSLAGVLGGKTGKYIAHGDELFLQYKFLFSKFGKLKDNDYAISKMVNSLWTAFAHQSPLVIAELDSGAQIIWEKYDIKHPKYLEISLKPKMIDGKLCSKDEFWTDAIPSLITSYRSKKDEL